MNAVPALIILAFMNAILLPTCSAQKTFDTAYNVRVHSSPPLAILPVKFNDQQKRDSIYAKHAARSYEEYARAMENYLLKIENPGISRDGTGVGIKLLNGGTLKLTPRFEYEDFTFAHYFKKEKLVVFKVLEVMDWSYMLVSLADGKTTTNLIGLPIFSPDKRMLMCFRSDVESGETKNGFQLFSFTEGTVKKIWEYHSGSWGPIAASWVDNSMIATRNEQLDGPEIFKKIVIIRAPK